MAPKSPVALILGAGPNIGQAAARHFSAQGYKVAIAARSLKEVDSTDAQLNIPSDFSKVDGVVEAFAKVKKVLGIPSVVIYNGMVSFSSLEPPPNPVQSVPVPSLRLKTRSLSPMTTLLVTRRSTY